MYKRQGKGRLTRGAIENVVKENTIDNIFAMIDAINNKKTAAALNEYEKLLDVYKRQERAVEKKLEALRKEKYAAYLKAKKQQSSEN